MASLSIVKEDDEIMVVSAQGITTRQHAGSISRQGRAATGVCVQSLVEGDQVIAVTKIIPDDEE